VAGTTSAPRDCTSIFSPPATRKPTHTHSFRSFRALPLPRALLCFHRRPDPGRVHLTTIKTSGPSLSHPTTDHRIIYKSPHVNHELAAEESCALVRHPSRRQRFHVSQCTFAGIGEISLQKETHSHVTMQVEMKRTAAALPLPLTTSKLANKLPRESPKVTCTLYHKPTTALKLTPRRRTRPTSKVNSTTTS
jgi:hypothetical protein